MDGDYLGITGVSKDFSNARFDSFLRVDIRRYFQAGSAQPPAVE